MGEHNVENNDFLTTNSTKNLGALVCDKQQCKNVNIFMWMTWHQNYSITLNLSAYVDDINFHYATHDETC